MRTTLAALTTTVLLSTYVSTAALADAVFEDSAAYIADRAHTASRDTSVIGLYNVTVPGDEVDALSTPTGGGFEYWPYVYDEDTGTHPSPYPNNVQWGYSAGSDAAQKCMKLSWHIWRYVQDNMPANLVEMRTIQGAPRSYYHWNNDYTNARTENVGYRRFWHYNAPNGLLKWISHTKIDGSCQHPTVEAIDRWAFCEIQRLRSTSLQCPGHS